LFIPISELLPSEQIGVGAVVVKGLDVIVWGVGVVGGIVEVAGNEEDEAVLLVILLLEGAVGVVGVVSVVSVEEDEAVLPVLLLEGVAIGEDMDG
jgi:predicted membrane channel-forming protein YqfA (hemolysin III family)